MRIKELTLCTSQIKRQTEFYSDILGLELTHCTENTSSFKIGTSTLTLKNTDQSFPYHFAINIPPNKEDEALGWLKSRVNILKDGSSEIQNFESWNARAIYFYDLDNNIVEFIARKNLPHGSTSGFDINQLLEISEIGVATNNIQPIYADLKRWINLDIYDGDFSRFSAIGDEHGLFICVNRQIKRWFPTNDVAFPSNFEIHLEEMGVNYHLKYQDEKIMLL